MRATPILAAVALTLVGCTTLPDVDLEQVDDAMWNGELTAEFPAVGALVRDGDARCTGTLIDPGVVLTAAHCVDGLTPGEIAEMSFYTGPGSPGPLDGGLPVEDALPHPDYNEVNADLALVFLTVDATEEPVWVWDTDMSPGGWNGTLVTLVGYGITEDGADDAGQKRRTEVEVYAFDEDVFFHYQDGTNACFGDSGGPALWSDGERWWDVGVISALFPHIYKDQVCVGGGGYEIRADVYLAWIEEYALINQEPAPGDDDDADDDDDGVPLDDGQGCQCTAAGAGPGPGAVVWLLTALLVVRRTAARAACPRAARGAPA